VLVITGSQPDAPALAQQDLAAAAEAQHASDLSAEKLPSIHDDQPSGTAGSLKGAAPSSPTAPGIAAQQPVTVPHPLPTEHPDRYTAGSTPPASQMTPGAPLSQQTSPGPSSQPPSGQSGRPSGQESPSRQASPQADEPK
jgi:rod shape-determining protein MreC